jgi:uncharacterized protein (TIGR03437 family)
MLPNQSIVSDLKRDPMGNLYLAGYGPSSIAGHGMDAFVTKLSSDGKVLFWTAFGGTQDETLNAVSLAPDGSTVVVGQTSSLDFPVTSDAAQHQGAPIATGFFARLNASGKVVYASYLNSNVPASIPFNPRDVELDSAGAVYITGHGAFTSTAGTLPGPPNTPSGDHLFILKLDAAGKLVFGTGSIGGDRITLDSQGFIYVAGEESADFPIPITPGAYESTAQFKICSSSEAFAYPCADQFIAKLDATASNLIYATWLSGSSGASPLALLVDAAGEVIVGGGTQSLDYPATIGAYQPVSYATSPPSQNPPLLQSQSPVIPVTGYITKLNSTGTGLIFSTFLGGSSQDVVTSLALDAAGRIYIGGVSSSPDFPGLDVVPSGCRPSYIYPVPFVARMSEDGSSLTHTQLAFGLTTATALGFFPAFIYELTAVDGQGNAWTQAGNALAFVDLFAPAENLTCTTDAADLAPLTSVAPGQLLSLFGEGIGPTAGAYQPKAGVYPSSQPGLSVTFNGLPGPLLYASPGQINVQVPYEIAGATSVRMEVRLGGDALTPGSLVGTGAFLVAASQPSAFVGAVEFATCNDLVAADLLAVASNSDGSFNSCSNPADLGSVIKLYLNGLGVADGHPATGAIATNPATPFPVSVTADGAGFVAIETNPGEIIGVTVVKIKLSSADIQTAEAAAVTVSLTVGGVRVREPLVIWVKPQH